MKPKNILCALLILFAIPAKAQFLSALSYNIRYDNAKDGINRWDNRKEELIGQLNKYTPDIIGIQEGLHHQVVYMDSSLIDYKYFGVGRDDGLTKGEYCAIFYKREKFKLLSDSTIWLSDNPQIVSVGWDASMERICTIGLFEERGTGKRIWVLNTHFDHRGNDARINSARLIVDTISEINRENLPLIIMGDFNSIPESKPIEILTKNFDDAYLLSNDDPKGPLGTYSGFRIEAELQRRIDYIFVKDFIVRSTSHLNERRKDNNFISDHLPVFVELELSE